MDPGNLVDSAMLRNLARGIVIVAGLFAVVALLEAKFGGNVRRHRSHAAATDIGYAVIYLGALYTTLISAPVLGLIDGAIPDSWRLHLLEGLPPVAAFFVYWVIADFLSYWIHRWEHNNPWLWRVHSLHHTQEVLTFATSWRNHLLEQLFINVLMFVPLMLLGAPAWFWLPIILLQYVFEALQHADLDWRFGRAYPVVVSPVFHAIHHAPERSRHDSNYGKILSLWDHLFGTIGHGERPSRYGLAGVVQPISFWETLWFPFRRGERASASPPQSTPEVAAPRHN